MPPIGSDLTHFCKKVLVSLNKLNRIMQAAEVFCIVIKQLVGVNNIVLCLIIPITVAEVLVIISSSINPGTSFYFRSRWAYYTKANTSHINYSLRGTKYRHHFITFHYCNDHCIRT